MPARAQAPQGIRVERVDLGDGAAGVQAHHLQELPLVRVFVRSQATFKRSQIYLQRRLDGRWLPPQPMPFADPRWRDADPHLDATGKTLTFISDRPEPGEAGPGPLRLFQTSWEQDRWSAPQALPPALQSPADAMGPERHGRQFFFASTRGAPGARLTVWTADLEAAEVRTAALPAPINEGGDNSDFTLTPDGRFALWWSSRDGSAGGADLYLSERVGATYGPAIRLPEPINGPGLEFAPSVSADGQWLYFSSSRDSGAGLSHVYRTGWPQLLQSLGRQAVAYSDQALAAEISALWRALNAAPGQPADAPAMARLLHPQARVFGQTLRNSQLGLRSWSAAEFVAMLERPNARGQVECETRRDIQRYGGHAQAYSVVQTRRSAEQVEPDFTGVNSMQWQLGPAGWQLLSLHYALALPGQPLPVDNTRPAACLD